MFLIHKYIKAGTIRRNMCSNRAKANYSPKPRVTWVKYVTRNNKNIGVGRIPTTPKTDIPLIGSNNTPVVLHTEILVSLGTNHLRYVTVEK